MTLKAAVFAVGFLAAAPLANAAEPVSAAATVVAHHMAVSGTRNIDAVLEDYADDAIVVTPDGVGRGKADLRRMFELVFSRQAPSASPSAPPTMLKQAFVDNVGQVIWAQNAGKPDEVVGVETYIVRDGKIQVQTVALTPVHP